MKQCAKDSPNLLTLLTPPTSATLPLPPAALSRLFSLSRLNQVLPHLHRPVGVVQLLVETAGVTDGRTLSVTGPPPQRGLVGAAVEAPGVRSQPQVFLLETDISITKQQNNSGSSPDIKDFLSFTNPIRPDQFSRGRFLTIFCGLFLC